MAGNLSGQAEVKCPFYLSHAPELRQVRCMGAREKTTVTLAFQTKKRFETYKKGYCDDLSRWQRCPYARVALLGCENRDKKGGGASG